MFTSRKAWLCVLCLIASLIAATGTCLAQENEFDNAKWKLQANVWISYPSGYFNGKDGNGYFDVQRDFGFGNYATFSGKLDWRFKRKHHFLFSPSGLQFSHKHAGPDHRVAGANFRHRSARRGQHQVPIFTPGYEYDFFRHRSGYLGVLVNANLVYTDAKLKAATTGGAAAQADGSIFAPLPLSVRCSAGIPSQPQAASISTERWSACLSSATGISFPGRHTGISNLHSLGRARWLPDG